MEDKFYVLNLTHMETYIGIINDFKNDIDYEEIIGCMIRVMKKGIDGELDITYKTFQHDYDKFNDKYNKIMVFVDSYSDYFQREDVIESRTLLDDDLRRQAYFASSNYDEFKNKLKMDNRDKIVFTGDACIAFSRASSFQEFMEYYKENSDLKETDPIKRLQQRAIMCRAYQGATTVEEFRDNLKNELAMTDSNNQGYVKRK